MLARERKSAASSTLFSLLSTNPNHRKEFRPSVPSGGISVAVIAHLAVPRDLSRQSTVSVGADSSSREPLGVRSRAVKRTDRHSHTTISVIAITKATAAAEAVTPRTASPSRGGFAFKGRLRLHRAGWLRIQRAGCGKALQSARREKHSQSARREKHSRVLEREKHSRCSARQAPQGVGFAFTVLAGSAFTVLAGCRLHRAGRLRSIVLGVKRHSRVLGVKTLRGAQRREKRRSTLLRQSQEHLAAEAPPHPRAISLGAPWSGSTPAPHSVSLCSGSTAAP